MYTKKNKMMIIIVMSFKNSYFHKPRLYYIETKESNKKQNGRSVKAKMMNVSGKLEVVFVEIFGALRTVLWTLRVRMKKLEKLE